MINLNEQKKDIVVVIRTAGERTVELCKNLVQSQVDENQIHVIEEKPFFKAVKKTIEIGSNSTAKYLLALDGDMLIYPDAIDYMIYSANKVDYKSFLRIAFQLLDKFRGEIIGAKFYNNYYSKSFLDLLNKIDDNKSFLRPEAEILKKFANQANLSISNNKDHDIGRHDYYQYYSDLYSKYRLRYRRCENDGDTDELKNYIDMKLKNNPDDADYLFVREIFNTAELDIDINDIMSKCGIVEKNPMNGKDFESIINSLSTFSVMDEYKKETNEKIKQWLDSYKSFKDFVDEISPCNNLKGNTAIYGSGVISELLLMSKRELNIKAIIDRNVEKLESYLCGIPIIPIDQIEQYNIDNILIASIAHKDKIRETINNTLKNDNLNIISLDGV